MRAAIAAALLVLIAGCSSGDPTTPPSSSTSTLATTTTTTATRKPGALADEWDKQYDALPSSGSCSPELAQTTTCADYLTKKVQLVSNLGAKLRARPDANSRYLDTLMAIEKVLDESKRYADAHCYEGGGSQADCHGIALLIIVGALNVKVSLRADDLDR